MVEPICSLCAAERAGQARHDRAGVLWPRRIYPRAPACGSVTAYITKGEIRSQLGGGPVETFKVGQSFFEPPGATHMVSANASDTEPAELIAVFVADEGAQLTTLSSSWKIVSIRRGSTCAQSALRAHPSGLHRREVPHTGFSVTLNPSRGFGIGHICQSGV